MREERIEKREEKWSGFAADLVFQFLLIFIIAFSIDEDKNIIYLQQDYKLSATEKAC